jgi:hypothetical protein
MIRPPNEPLVRKDITEEIDSVIRDGKPVIIRRELWPFSLITCTYITGSVNYILEFRVVMKWCVGISFFWKASGKKTD